MNILDYIKQRIRKFLGIDYLPTNPYAERFTFICDEKNIKEQQLDEYNAWYSGDSNELLLFYTGEDMYGNAREPVYNRNRHNYFWELSTKEAHIKRVHSGIPRAIITTLVNAINSPKIKTNDKEIEKRIEKIIEDNDFINMLNQQQMPLTMVEGWGAFKVNLDKELSDTPRIQYYSAKDVELIVKSGVLLGIIYKDYYQSNGKNYVLFETRRIAKEEDGSISSLVEYELFRLVGKNEVEPAELGDVPELEGLQNFKIPNYKHILGVPSRFFYDKTNENYGLSLFAGKIDLFDDLDQDLSQNSQTVRVSTPVEYYKSNAIERDKNGRPIMPDIYNRQYIDAEGVDDGDGHTNGPLIQTTQPQLNFDQYSQNAKMILDYILTGVLSPATMGIDVAKKDNAEAQREKEKVTIMTRNNIIDRETRILKELMSICLSLDEYMRNGVISIQDYDISVTFDEFANPSFENELQTLGSAYSNGLITPERFVDLVWGDKLNDEEKAVEVEYLKAEKERESQDDLMMGDFEQDTPNGIPTDL